jgi:hypothetical protein
VARSLTNRFCGFVYVVAVASVTVLSVSCAKAGSDKTVTEALTHETDDKLGDPGFRPYSEHASAFLNAVDTATIAVYPTIVRKADGTSHSFESQKQIVALLRQKEMAAPAAGSSRVDLGRLEPTSQWGLFLNDMQRIAETLKGQASDADYHLFMELVWPVNDQPIFGIHCYVFDRQGQNAFSFLLGQGYIRSSAQQVSEKSHRRWCDRFRGASCSGTKKSPACGGYRLDESRSRRL